MAASLWPELATVVGELEATTGVGEEALSVFAVTVSSPVLSEASASSLIVGAPASSAMVCWRGGLVACLAAEATADNHLKWLSAYK